MVPIFIQQTCFVPPLSDGAGKLREQFVCAGQEVTQYTYFQQAAGQALPVPSVEITYGLERILTALQVRASVWD